MKTLQRKTGVIILGTIVALAGYVALSSAQEAKHVPLMGTVTLKGGKTLQGDLLLVAFGVTEAARFGSDKVEVDEGGKLELDVNGEKKTIRGPDIATVEAEWTDVGTEEKSDWQIVSLTVTTRDGQTVTGKPSWFMPMSGLRVDPGEGEDRIELEVYPLFRTEFDPDSLIVKVDLSGAAPAEAEKPTPVETPPVPPIPTPTVETPEEEAPTEEEPAVEAVPPVTPPPAVAPAVETREPAPQPKPATLSLTIICPHCGERITVNIDAHAA